MADRVNVSIDGHVAVVTLDRADKHNAIDLAMFDDIADAGERLGADRGVRAVVLHGAGDHFCAGIDVNVFTSGEAEIDEASMAPRHPSIANRFQRAAYVWRELPVPVICAVHGAAYGAGAQLALGADIRYASRDARLSIMEIKWGLIPDLAISVTTRGLLRTDRLRELAYTGRVVGADEALSIGLVTAVFDDPLSTALDSAREIARKSPDAIRAIKTLFNTASVVDERDALALEARLQLGVLGGRNQAEAVRANLESRAPDFSD